MPRKPVSDEERRKRHISVWLSDAEYEEIAAAADHDQDPPSTWLRKLGLREARGRKEKKGRKG